MTFIGLAVLNSNSIGIHPGTQAQPIDLSNASDKDIDSDATTDDESSPSTARITNVDGADEDGGRGDTQVTLSDSAFDSQGQLQGVSCRSSRIQNRKEAYQAAKRLASSGLGDGFVIVSSRSTYGEEEIEL